jgi:hypothetical protein
VEGLRVALGRTRERVDSYTLELQRHGLEAVERDVRWLNELIAEERRSEGNGAAGGPYPTAEPTDINPGIDRGSEKESS